MRTAEEITKEIEELRTRTLGSIEKAFEKVNERMAERLVSGTDEDKWIAKQYHGHIGMVYHLSTVSPLPIDATKTALDGLKSLALIVDRLGWADSACFIIVANDMLQHFEDVIRLKKELLELSPATVEAIHKNVNPPSSTIH